MFNIFISEGIRQDNRLVHCDSTDQLKMSFPSIDYAFSGYDVVQGYPLSKGRDPGFKSAIFKANYKNSNSNGDCRYTLPKGIMAVPDVSCDVSFKSDIVKTTSEFHDSLCQCKPSRRRIWIRVFCKCIVPEVNFRYGF